MSGGGGAPAQQNQSPFSSSGNVDNSTAQQMVNSAYGQIGRAGIGTNPNQIDQAGSNYWMGQLTSGALRPGEFNTAFRSAAIGADPSMADRYYAQDLSQVSGARPTSNTSQFFQPVYQPQYQDYSMGNRMGLSQYGQGYGGFNPYAMQMQTQFNPYINSFQSPFSYFQPMQPQVNYGPAQPIVSRSAGMRGTPNVMMRRAEGGIASLLDD